MNRKNKTFSTKIDRKGLFCLFAIPLLALAMEMKADLVNQETMQQEGMEDYGCPFGKKPR